MPSCMANRTYRRKMWSYAPDDADLPDEAPQADATLCGAHHQLPQRSMACNVTLAAQRASSAVHRGMASFCLESVEWPLSACSFTVLELVEYPWELVTRREKKHRGQMGNELAVILYISHRLHCRRPPSYCTCTTCVLHYRGWHMCTARTCRCIPRIQPTA